MRQIGDPQWFVADFFAMDLHTEENTLVIFTSFQPRYMPNYMHFFFGHHQTKNKFVGNLFLFFAHFSIPIHTYCLNYSNVNIWLLIGGTQVKVKICARLPARGVAQFAPVDDGAKMQIHRSKSPVEDH
jgi:hypothetical protein